MTIALSHGKETLVRHSFKQNQNWDEYIKWFVHFISLTGFKSTILVVIRDMVDMHTWPCGTMWITSPVLHDHVKCDPHGLFVCYSGVMLQGRFYSPTPPL